uniref:Uncharacterized protein n=1 Tax=Arundo donax TaxID=35708 RepID=A0A0A9AUR5_ARUDO
MRLAQVHQGCCKHF